MHHIRTSYVNHTNKRLSILTYHAEKLAPRKFKRKTGEIIKLLLKNPTGLSRSELLMCLCQNFDSASFTRRESLRMSLEKLIQRARKIFSPFHLTIKYDKSTKKYQLDSIEKRL